MAGRGEGGDGIQSLKTLEIVMLKLILTIKFKNILYYLFYKGEIIMANQVIFVNQPDINKIMRNLCEVANRDCKGEYEYTYG